MAVILTFNAAAVSPATDTDITVTFGNGKTHMRWTDRQTMPFSAFATLLSDSPVGTKDGACYTPAALTGVQRHLTQTERLDIAVLDSDCGHTLSEIAAAARSHGWECIIHSTFSHMVDETLVSVSAYDKWRADNGDDPGRYMREKKGYLPRVSEGAFILDEREKHYILKHQPCPKYRVIFRLDRPWIAADFESQSEANARWAKRLNALAHTLGLQPDESCTDTSRLFFMPRRPNADRAYEFDYIPGNPCGIWDLADAPDSVAAAPDLFAAPAPRPRPMAVSIGDKTWGGKINLTHWAATHAERFEVVAALKARQPGVFGHRKSGAKHHLQCPFDDEHTNPNDRTGTFAVNASEIKGARLPLLNSGFYVACKHAACSGRDRLDFVTGMLDKGWLDESDLTGPDFLIQEAYDLRPVDFGVAMAAADQEAEEKPGNLPDYLLTGLPGIMGPMVEYILATSHKPQPILALGATMAAMSAALGRKVEISGYGTRSNIYIVGIAHSGAGKDRPMTAVKDVFRKAGVVDKFLGAEKLASDAGLVMQAKLKPCHVMLLDEVGYMMASTADRNSGTHVKDIVPTLLTLFSSCKTVYQSKAYADAERCFTINQPSVSMFGASTPSTLYDALRTSDIKTGLLSRVVVFDCGDHDPLQEIPPGAEIPESVVDWFKAWSDTPESDNPAAMEGGEPAIHPRKIGLSAAAAAVFRSFAIEMHTAKKAARKDGTDPLYVRSVENALKFALIRAAAEGPDAPLEINESAAKWAVDVSRRTTMHMVTIATASISDTTYQRNLTTFREIIRKAGSRGVTDAELMRRKACQVPHREYKDIIEYLLNAQEIVNVNTNAGQLKSNGVQKRERSAWVWIGGMALEES